MKKIILILSFTSILFLTITTSLFSQDVVGITLTYPITCANGTAQYTITTTANSLSPFQYQVQTLTGSGWVDYGSLTTCLTPPYFALTLQATTYRIQIFDLIGNFVSESIQFVVNQPLAVVQSAPPAITNVACNGESTGSIQVSVNGGTPPYAYNWVSGQTTDLITGLSIGTYICSIFDDNGCAYVNNPIVVSVSQPPALTAAITGSNVNCWGGNDGSASVNVSGGTGTGTYSYEWDDPLQQGTATAIDLVAGTYSCDVTDQNGCDITVTLDLTINPATNTFTSISPSAFSACDGFLLSNVVSTYPIVSYSWENSQGSFMGSSNFISNVCNDAYILTLIDSLGCTLTDTIVLGTIMGCTDLLAINYDWVANSDDASCIPVTLGCTDVTASNYDANSNIDDGSCLYCDLSIGLFISQTSSDSACDGFIVISSIQSSSMPATYLWSTGSMANNIIGLCSGTYTLNITDAVGCTIDTSITIGQVSGCTDVTACNYDATASVDDGTCEYVSCDSTVCTEDAPTGLNATDVLQNRATINWDNMNDANCMVDQYRIKYKAVGTSSWIQKNMGQPVGSCLWATQNTDKLILNLIPSTTYEYQMKAWYCGGGNSAWSAIETFTTQDDCPNVGNLVVTSAYSTHATFDWDDSNGAYSFMRIKARVDTNNATWFNVGGSGVSYGVYTKNKNGLSAGTSYRAQSRTWCDPNGGGWKSPTWTPLIYWTQPASVRLEGGTAIANLDVYPNPSRDVFNISFTSEGLQDLKVRVLNLIGEELINDKLEQFIGEYTKAIDLSENTKGIYFLEIETNDGIINKKLILQ